MRRETRCPVLTPAPLSAASPLPRPEWLSKREEEILEPELEIIDPHHHLWDMSGRRYLIDELLGDLGERPQDRRDRVSRMCGHVPGRGSGAPAPGRRGRVRQRHRRHERVGAVRVDPDLRGYRRVCRPDARRCRRGSAGSAGRSRKRPVPRHPGTAPGTTRVPISTTPTPTPPPGIYADPVFREGFAKLADFDLSFEAWLYHPQLDDIAGLADAFPGQRMVLNHCGGPLGIGPYVGRREEILAGWQASMRELARRDNVHVKLGGLGMIINGLPVRGSRDFRPGRRNLRDTWRPWFETLIEAFGVRKMHVREQLSGRQGHGGLRDLLERVQADCRRRQR